MGMLAALGGMLALGLGGGRVARRALGLPRGFPVLFGGFLVAWTWACLGTLGLGLVGWLARWPLLGWTVGGAVAAHVATRRLSGAADEGEPGPPGAWGFEVPLAIGLAAWAALSVMIPSLVMPVKVVSDGPIYHLYFAARWWQEGRIFLVPTPFGETAAPYFPAVGDLWLTWLFVLEGGDRLARVGQVPFYLLAIACVYDLARRAGARPAASAIATCWFATTAPLLVFTFEPVVDTIFIAGYLLAVWFAARSFRDGGGVVSLALAGIAAGGAWGTKAPGIVFVPPLLGLIVLGRLLRPGAPAAKARDVVVLLGATLVLEGFWPARNAWLTGNPLYPLEVRAFGRTIFPGWFSPEVMAHGRYYLPFASWRAAADILVSVFDPRLTPAWLAAIAGAWRLGTGRRRGDGLAWACAGLAVLNLGLYWGLIPYRTELRFSLHSVALAAVPLARLLDRSRTLVIGGSTLLAVRVLTSESWPAPALFGSIPWDLVATIPNDSPAPVTLVSVVSWFVRDPRSDATTVALVVGCGVASIAAGFLLRWANRAPRRRWPAPAAAILAAGVMYGTMIQLRLGEPIYHRYPEFRDYLFGWADLDTRAGDAPARVAYAGTNLPYYLMGPGFARRVRYVNVDDHRGWLLHDYHRAAGSMGLPTTWPDPRPGWDRLRPRYEDWLANLDAEGIQLLVVARADPAEGRFNPFDAEGFPVERSFAGAHPERFALLHAEPRFRLYAVRPAGKIRAGPTDRAAGSH